MDNICPICHEEFENNKNICTTICNHKFHTNCLLNVKNYKCPLCRNQLIDLNEDFEYKYKKLLTSYESLNLDYDSLIDKYYECKFEKKQIDKLYTELKTLYNIETSIISSRLDCATKQLKKYQKQEEQRLAKENKQFAKLLNIKTLNRFNCLAD